MIARGLILLSVGLTLCVGGAVAAGSPTPAGTWTGTFALPRNGLPVAFSAAAPG